MRRSWKPGRGYRIQCNCQGCDACVPYGAWAPADEKCACEGGEV